MISSRIFRVTAVTGTAGIPGLSLKCGETRLLRGALYLLAFGGPAFGLLVFDLLAFGLLVLGLLVLGQLVFGLLARGRLARAATAFLLQRLAHLRKFLLRGLVDAGE